MCSEWSVVHVVAVCCGESLWLICACERAECVSVESFEGLGWLFCGAWGVFGLVCILL